MNSFYETKRQKKKSQQEMQYKDFVLYLSNPGSLMFNCGWISVVSVLTDAKGGILMTRKLKL